MPDDVPAERRHPSDLTDAEWSALGPLLARRSHLGRPLKWPRRLMADAVFHLLRTGCQWRMLPRCFPPWPTVFSQFRRWRMDGTIRAAHDRLRRRVREAEGRDAEPTAAILDSQSVRTTGVGGPARGYDGGKKVKGPLCCTDRRCGRAEPYLYAGSCDADVLRASELEHAVQHVRRDRHLGRLTPIGP